MNTPGQVEDLLLAELRHRTASTFQLLQALIHIRLRHVPDPESRRHLSWLLDVVTALGMLQSRLGGRGLAEFGAYLEEAAAYWRRIGEGANVGLELDVQPAEVSDVEATTLALIAHELVSNAMEHGFPEGRGGAIRVRLRELADGARELVVADDGCGLPAHVEPDKGQGLELVRGLASHLGGWVEVSGGPGVTARVLIPASGAPRRN